MSKFICKVCGGKEPCVLEMVNDQDGFRPMCCPVDNQSGIKADWQELTTTCSQSVTDCNQFPDSDYGDGQSGLFIRCEISGKKGKINIFASIADYSGTGFCVRDAESTIVEKVLVEATQAYKELADE